MRLTKGHFGSRRQIVTDCGCRPKAVVRQVLGHGGVKVVPGWRQHAATVPGDGHAALGRDHVAPGRGAGWRPRGTAGAVLTSILHD